MEIGAIEGATRNLGRPTDWDEATQGKCYCLPILDTKTPEGDECMISAWIPNAEDLVALNRGESIKLCVVGTGHPVVSIFV